MLLKIVIAPYSTERFYKKSFHPVKYHGPVLSSLTTFSESPDLELKFERNIASKRSYFLPNMLTPYLELIEKLLRLLITVKCQ